MCVCVCVCVCVPAHYYVTCVQALGLLEYLMEQCQTPKLIEFAALLDPFPSQDPFSELAARWHEIRDTTGELSIAEVT